MYVTHYFEWLFGGLFIGKMYTNAEINKDDYLQNIKTLYLWLSIRPSLSFLHLYYNTIQYLIR